MESSCPRDNPVRLASLSPGWRPVKFRPENGDNGDGPFAGYAAEDGRLYQDLPWTRPIQMLRIQSASTFPHP